MYQGDPNSTNPGFAQLLAMLQDPQMRQQLMQYLAMQQPPPNMPQAAPSPQVAAPQPVPPPAQPATPPIQQNLNTLAATIPAMQQMLSGTTPPHPVSGGGAMPGGGRQQMMPWGLGGADQSLMAPTLGSVLTNKPFTINRMGGGQ